MDAIRAAYESSDPSEDGSSSDVSDDCEAASLNGAEGCGGRGRTDVDDGTALSLSRKRQRTAESATTAEVPWKRSFAHVEGNWPSHVKIAIPVDPERARICEQLLQRAHLAVSGAVELISMAGGDANEGYHMSLSRPFVLTFDQIDAFVAELRAALKWRRRFAVTLDKAVVLVNDERTRSFLALTVGAGRAACLDTLRRVDKCMTRFQLPTYYEAMGGTHWLTMTTYTHGQNPIPHTSIASALGDTLPQLLPSDQVLQLFPVHGVDSEIIGDDDDDGVWMIQVMSVQVVIGNKHFDIPLQ